MITLIVNDRLPKLALSSIFYNSLSTFEKIFHQKLLVPAGTSARYFMCNNPEVSCTRFLCRAKYAWHFWSKQLNYWKSLFKNCFICNLGRTKLKGIILLVPHDIGPMSTIQHKDICQPICFTAFLFNRLLYLSFLE